MTSRKNPSYSLRSEIRSQWLELQQAYGTRVTLGIETAHDGTTRSVESKGLAPGNRLLLYKIEYKLLFFRSFIFTEDLILPNTTVYLTSWSSCENWTKCESTL